MTLDKNLMMTAMLVLPASVALGQTKPPVAHFWADVATHSMSIPGMDDMDEGSMGMFGGFFGGKGWSTFVCLGSSCCLSFSAMGSGFGGCGSGGGALST